MSAVQAACAVDCKNVLGEGAVWCPREQLLWWIDISSPTLWRLDPRTSRVDHWPLPKPPGSFALRKNGGFLFAFRNGLATLDAPGGELQWLEAPGLVLGDERFNDGKVDRAGRFWAGHARSQARRRNRAALPGRAGFPRHRDGSRLHDLERHRLEPRRPHPVLHRHAVAADLPLRLRRRHRRDREPARVRRSRGRSRRPRRHDGRRGGLRLERAVRPLVHPSLRARTGVSSARCACQCSGRRRACSADPTSRRCT